LAFSCLIHMQSFVIINQIHYTLEDILKDTWHRLINGANSAKHAFHCPSIATINNGFPEIRTIVLRKAIPEENTLIFHTDYRSPKIEQIKINNAISWLFYDAKSRIQLRIKTRATIEHNNEISFKRWNDSRLESRKCYMVQPASSSPVETPTDGLPGNFDHENLSDEDIAQGYKNFAVIKCGVTEIDWLFLNHDGHRRAKFIWREKQVNKFWVVP